MRKSRQFFALTPDFSVTHLLRRKLFESEAAGYLYYGRSAPRATYDLPPDLFDYEKPGGLRFDLQAYAAHFRLPHGGQADCFYRERLRCGCTEPETKSAERFAGLC